MARSYAPLLTTIWADDDFRALSGAAQRLYLLALSQPNVSYAGVVAFTARRWARMAADTTSSDIDKAIAELEAARFLLFDDDTEELFVRSFVKHNGVLRQPQLRTAMRRAFGEILSPAIRAAFLQEVPDQEKQALAQAHPTLLAGCPTPAGSLPEGCRSTGDTGLVEVTREEPQTPNPEPASPPEHEPSSSSRLLGRARPDLFHRPDDDGETKIANACRLIAERKLVRITHEKGPRGDEDAWLASVTKTERDKHQPIARAHLADEPAMTAAQLADELEPGLAPRQPAPDCGTCGNTTWLGEDADGCAIPCPDCRTLDQ